MTDQSLLGDSPKPQQVVPHSDYIQPNLNHGLRIWWALFWRTTLIDIFTVTGPSMAFHLALGPYWSYSFDYGAALAMMYFVVRKKFRTFHIRLVSIADRTQTLEPTSGAFSEFGGPSLGDRSYIGSSYPLR